MSLSSPAKELETPQERSEIVQEGNRGSVEHLPDQPISICTPRLFSG